MWLVRGVGRSDVVHCPASVSGGHYFFGGRRLGCFWRRCSCFWGSGCAGVRRRGDYDCGRLSTACVFDGEAGDKATVEEVEGVKEDVREQDVEG